MTTQTSKIFDRNLLRKRHERLTVNKGADFLKHYIVDHLLECLADINRRFERVLEIGCHHGLLQAPLMTSGRVDQLIQADYSYALLKQASGMRVQMDEERPPFAWHSMDAIIVSGGLHWVNDLPGTLLQLRHLLKPDGLLLAMMPGPQSLRELRESFAAVETATGSIMPHIAPFVEVRDAGQLLQHAGFALPVIDSHLLTLDYGSPLQLMQELQQMGENNHLQARFNGCYSPRLMHEMQKHYLQQFGQENGRIKATIEWVTMTAWAPDASQQKPAARGSGRIDLADFLNS